MSAVLREDSTEHSLNSETLLLLNFNTKAFPTHPANHPNVNYVDTSSHDPQQTHAAVLPTGDVSIRFGPDVVKL